MVDKSEKTIRRRFWDVEEQLHTVRYSTVLHFSIGLRRTTREALLSATFVKIKMVEQMRDRSIQYVSISVYQYINISYPACRKILGGGRLAVRSTKKYSVLGSVGYWGAGQVLVLARYTSVQHSTFLQLGCIT